MNLEGMQDVIIDVLNNYFEDLRANNIIVPLQFSHEAV